MIKCNEKQKIRKSGTVFVIGKILNYLTIKYLYHENKIQLWAFAPPIFVIRKRLSYSHLKVLVFLLFITNFSFGQLPFGATAPNWTLTPIPDHCVGAQGPIVDLYTVLETEKKHVIIDFFGTTCGPCWEYHQEHYLEDLWNLYGPDDPNNPDDNPSDEIRVYAIETYPFISAECICGNCPQSNTLGDWTYGTSYPFYNPDHPEWISLQSDYAINYSPTFYAINADHKTVWDVEHFVNHRLSIAEWESWLFGSFSLEVDASITTSDCSTTIDITATGGYTENQGLTYKWNTGETTEDISGRLNGTYTVTVTDENGYFIVKEEIVSANYNANCDCFPEMNVDLSSNTEHTISDLLAAMNLSSISELNYSSEQYNILIGGTLVISNNSIFFNSDKIKMLKDAKIVVENGGVLRCENTHISGCNIWDKIYVKDGGVINFTHESTLADSKYGIFGERGSKIVIRNAVFFNNDIGIYLDSGGTGENAYTAIKDCKFTSNQSFFSFPNNVPPIMQRPKAGIYIDGHKNVDFKNENGENIFENLSNGILCKNGSINIFNSSFTDIYGVSQWIPGPNGTDDPPGLFTPNEYFFLQQDGFAIKIDNSTSICNVNECEFSNNFCAIGSNNSSLYIKYKEISNVHYGVMGYESKIWLFPTITGNLFSAIYNGVFLYKCYDSFIGGTNFRNYIDITGNHPNSIGMDIENSSHINVRYNEIEIGTNAGIFLQNSSDCEISNNIVEPDDNTSDQSIGIALINSDDNWIHHNYQYKPDDNVKGLFASNSQNVLYEANGFEGFKYGMHFDGMCDNSTLICNYFWGNYSDDLIVGNPELINVSIWGKIPRLLGEDFSLIYLCKKKGYAKLSEDKSYYI